MAKSGDIRDSHLGGRALFEQWKQEFMAEFYAQDVENLIRLQLIESIDSAPPEQLAIMQQQNPKEYKQMLDFINGGKNDQLRNPKNPIQYPNPG